jgi:hypothetical protein
MLSLISLFLEDSNNKNTIIILRVYLKMDNNLPVVFYAGIGVNSLICLCSILSCAFIAIKMYHALHFKEKIGKTWLVFIILSQISLFLYAGSILITYLKMNTVRGDLEYSEIPITNGVLIFFTGFIIFYFLGVLWEYGFQKNAVKWAGVIFSCMYIGTAIPLRNYTVFWYEGYVTIRYLNATWNRINFIFTNLILGIIFIISLIRFLQTRIITQKMNASKSIEEENDILSIKINSKLSAFRSIWNLLITLVLLAGIILPTAEKGGLINPVSIKFIGIGIYLSALVFQIKLVSPIVNYGGIKSLYIEIDSENLEQFKSYEDSTQNKIILNLIFLLVIFILSNLLKNYIQYFPDSQSGVDAGIYYYLFTNREILWFGHLWGLIIPGILGVIIGIIGIFIQKRKFTALIYIFLVIGSQLLIFSILHYFFREDSDNQIHFLNSLAFYIPPILGVIIWFKMTRLKNKKEQDYFGQIFKNMSIFKSPLSPLNIYLATLFSTIISDLFYPSSPTGKILIGGDGIVDGIVIFPLVAAGVYSLIILFFALFFPSSTILLKETPSNNFNRDK